MNWTPFYFDGNQWFGEVNSPEDWRDVLRTYCVAYVWSKHDLLRAKRGSDLPGYMPRFGFYGEYTGPQTLGEWAKEQGMEL